MATRHDRSILVCEMVVGAYIERHSLICCPRGRWRAVEYLGAGWSLLLSSPIYLPQKATLPGSPLYVPSGVALERPGGSRLGGAYAW